MDFMEQKRLPIHPIEKDSLQQESLVALVRRLRKGDRAAAESLVDRFYRRIYLYLRELGFRSHESEDLTQETFMRAWNSIDRLHDEQAFSAWLYRIASNAAREQWRRNKRRHELSSQYHETGQKIALDEIEQAQDLKDCHERLLRAVESLSWKHREAVVLHYLQEFSITATAKIAGVKEGTLKSRLSRALEILRERMSLNRAENGYG